MEAVFVVAARASAPDSAGQRRWDGAGIPFDAGAGRVFQRIGLSKAHSTRH